MPYQKMTGALHMGPENRKRQGRQRRMRRGEQVTRNRAKGSKLTQMRIGLQVLEENTGLAGQEGAAAVPQHIVSPCACGSALRGREIDVC
jgi:hypothetical protein